jgi:16S rRNA A1518/A1519 N6-dimethyltransferase RsmA/KsgA/DIM1 with predicted DNA glycosylase/AP lyase activity
VPVARFEAVDRLVRTAFQQRRKTLANALRPLTSARDAAGGAPLDLAAVLHGAGVEPTRRPETLTAEEFVHLADTLIPLSVL